MCPGFLEITGSADNLWFLNLLASVADSTKLARLRRSTLRKIPGVGQTHAAQIQASQKQAQCSAEIRYVGDMIIEDAHRMLALHQQIQKPEAPIQAALIDSEMGQILHSSPGFGLICSAELAGEIG